MKQAEFNEHSFLDWNSLRVFQTQESLNCALPDCFVVCGERVRLSENLAKRLYPGAEHAVISLSDFLTKTDVNGVFALKWQIQQALDGTCVTAALCFCEEESTPQAMARLCPLEDGQALGIVMTASVLSNFGCGMAALSGQLTDAKMSTSLIMEGATDYAYTLDFRYNTLTVSPKIMQLLPLDSPSIDQALETWTSLILPEDRQEFESSMVPFLEGQSLYHEAEYRMRTRSGKFVWIACHGKGTHDKGGKPIMLAGTMVDITDQKEHEEKIRRLANVDVLTNLKNRYCFAAELEQELRLPYASGAVLIMDVDDFKVFNEVFGHEFGNQILLNVSQLLRREFPADAEIYRLSSDEFAVKIPGASMETVVQTLERFMPEIRRQRTVNDHAVYMTISVGVAFYPEHGAAPSEVLKSADIAMHTAKNSGKNTVSYFVPSGPEEMARRYVLETELRTAVDNDFEGFRVVYQPIVNASSGRWIGAEALLRWVSPTCGPVGVEEVIRLLEYTGLIMRVGVWVLRTAVKRCAGWHRNGFSEAMIHVNLSVVQMDDPALCHNIREALEEFALPPQCLMLELTETLLIQKMTVALDFCRQVQEMGVGISMDDFGTGYSSLSYLRQLPINQIKVDRSFLENVEKDDYNQSIISMVRNLAHSINLTFCVEGVEEGKVWDLIKTMGADVLQGYLFGKPMEADEFDALYPSSAGQTDPSSAGLTEPQKK